MESLLEIYNSIFANWLHVHFALRTLVLILALWLAIVLLALIIRFAIAPGIMRIYGQTYKQSIVNAKKMSYAFMITCGVLVAIGGTALGLYQHYAPSQPTVALQPTILESPGLLPIPQQAPETEPELPYMPIPQRPTPSPWPEYGVLALTPEAREGSPLRSGPGVADYSIIEILWDNAMLRYLNEFTPDPLEPGHYWLHVLSPAGLEGYISSHLVVVIGE